jgi:hypothetical protein
MTRSVQRPVSDALPAWVTSKLTWILSADCALDGALTRSARTFTWRSATDALAVLSDSRWNS